MLGAYPLFLIAALVALWPVRQSRAWLLATLAIVIVTAVWTSAYFIREIDPLMVQAGAGLTPEQMTERAGAWLFWDRIRLVLIVIAWLTALRAYRASAAVPRPSPAASADSRAQRPGPPSTSRAPDLTRAD